MISLREPEWDSENASELRDFLKSETGARLLENLVYARPNFLASAAHPHKSFACSREIHGYEQAVKKLLTLIEAEEPLNAATTTAPNVYPDLDDDTQWQAEIPA